jgi:nitroreductase
MAVLEIIKNRRSIRKFYKKEIPKKIIKELIEVLIWAPSAGNLQSRKFYFVLNQDVKEKIAEAAFDQSSIVKAPLIIVGCTDSDISKQYGERGKGLYSICDVATAVQNLMLLAYDRGLGTVWVGKFEEKEVSKILVLPENLRPIVIVPIGYPAEKPPVPRRVKKDKAIKFINK